MNGFFLRTKILCKQTRIASKITSDNTTSTVPILTPQRSDKYAKAKPKTNVPASLRSPYGFRSTILYTAARIANKIASMRTISKIEVVSGDMSEYIGNTTNVMSHAIVAKPIVDTPLACPLMPSKKLTAFIQSIHQTTLPNVPIIGPNVTWKFPKENESIDTPVVYTIANDMINCVNNLILAGICRPKKTSSMLPTITKIPAPARNRITSGEATRCGKNKTSNNERRTKRITH